MTVSLNTSSTLLLTSFYAILLQVYLYVIHSVYFIIRYIVILI